MQDRPDCDFSADADPVNRPAAEEFKYLLEQTEIADIFDHVIRQRFGELIAQAARRVLQIGRVQQG
jgi:hypothetical protein